MILTLWWISVGLLAYVLFIYPALIALWALTRPPAQPPASAETPPLVSILVPVYNEAAVVEEKLANTLAIEHPSDRLEIIVASDGSTDDSVARLRAHPNPRVTVMEFPENRGKAALLNDLVPRATGEILVLTDAGGMVHPHALQATIPHFQDPDIGCVCGTYHVRKAGRGSLEAAEQSYLGFEMQLRLWEGRIRTSLSGTGAWLALRKADYVPLPDQAINDDFILPARIALSGKRVLYEPRAPVFDQASSSLAAEFRRRVRIAYGNWQQVGYLPELLNPARGYLWWVFVSHKLLRMAAPFLVACGWFASYVLSPVLVGWISLGIAVLLALGFAVRGRLAFIAMIFLHCAAVLVGTVRYLSGRNVRW